MPPDAKWKCPACGEDVSDNYAECWNCSKVRPDLPTYADQVAVTIDQQAQMQRQLECANEYLKKQAEQSQLIDGLLMRWDAITEKAEALLSKLERTNEQK